MERDEIDDAKDINHVTMIETAAGAMQPRSLFGHPRGKEKSSVSLRPSRYDEQIPEPKRVKRDLDYNEPLVSPLIDKRLPSNDDSHSATRATTPTSLGQTTQEVDYSQCSTVSALPQDILVLEVIYGQGHKLRLQLNEMSDFSIGRYDSNDFSIFSRFVSSHQHCLLRQIAFDEVELHAVARSCWVVSERRWTEVEKGKNVRLVHCQPFRLIRPPKNGSSSSDIASKVTFRLLQLPADVEFSRERLSLIQVPKLMTPSLVDTDCQFEYYQVQLSVPNACVRPGSASFDFQYKLLLEEIHKRGQPRCNKKGPSITLRSWFGLEVDLSDSSKDNDGLGKYLLPLTTLRSLYGGWNTIVEAIFYLRGENNISFLQKFGCKFWDKQADANGFIGYNYGLLTCFPQSDGTRPVNQLETKVISKLVNGECSRNMVCALLKPGELTNQEACTASVQFSVSTEKAIEVLDITVNQRSSDVMIGLPHDVCCWSVILHLVRREVYRRCGRLLAAGKVFFVIAAGGAHVYDANKESFEKLRTRDPYLDVSPELIIKTGRSIFEMAQNFEREMVQVNGYHPHHRAITIEQVV